MNDPRPSPENEKKYELDENKIPNCRRADKIHLIQNTETTSMCPQQYTLQVSQEVKTIPAKQRLYKQTIKTF